MLNCMNNVELDENIQKLNGEIRKDFLENEQMREYHYITYDDMLNIYKTAYHVLIIF